MQELFMEAGTFYNTFVVVKKRFSAYNNKKLEDFGISIYKKMGDFGIFMYKKMGIFGKLVFWI